MKVVGEIRGHQQIAPIGSSQLDRLAQASEVTRAVPNGCKFDSLRTSSDDITNERRDQSLRLRNVRV
jgi:hypothetical protein